MDNIKDFKVIINKIFKELKYTNLGIWDLDKKEILNPKADPYYISKNITILHPDDIVAHKCGNVFNIPFFIYRKLKEHYDNVVIYFMKSDTIDHKDIYPILITTIVQAEDGNWYNVEGSWLRNYGASGPYKSVEDFIKYIEPKFEKYYGSITLRKFIEDPNSLIDKLPMSPELFIKELF